MIRSSQKALLTLVVYFLLVGSGMVRSQAIDYSRINASGGAHRPALAPIKSDSTRNNKPSLLTIKVFSGDITQPLTSAVAVMTSRVTNRTERVVIANGQLTRIFEKPDNLTIEVSAAGYRPAQRTMAIAVSPQGNRYEFDAQLDRMTISLTMSAVDRSTNKIIPDVRFTISSKISGMTSTTLTPDATTGLSKIELPSKGTYVVSSIAKGYADFVKPIKLDSAQNEARFILTASPKPEPVKPQSLPEISVVGNASPPGPPIDRARPTVPVIRSTIAGPSVAVKQPFGVIEKGKPVRLNDIYFDQSSPVLRPESFTELDQLSSILLANPTMQIEIRGHTDNQGDFDLNVKLSRDRCQAIIDYLVGKGIQKIRLKAVGRGPIDPIAPNNTEENRRKNRRVEFVVI
ncbi:OmpA family protein [Spirosoma radiotolerans]|uniref:Flagellar motor protein MotB n=1 Tax=Spirosoma radiotolerans TaxID=1379870 RepID=A0A0E4A0U9_9BACT|nr:OmpA family protein [Spirosoma radiotolerans]AKD58623.1 flagellar motor protein MotB [Spirosoma radiotolerans]